MSKKYKHHGHSALSTSQLRERIDRAAGEGRFQQALDLAKQLDKTEATPQHRELLLSTYLGRARQLRTQGQTRDAATTLQAVLQLGPLAPGWLEQFAQELAACGAIKQALDLIGDQPESPCHGAVLNQAVDAAILQEAAGPAALPQSLHEDFDRVVRACGQISEGQDDAARNTLQLIGLRSPFLEWKVMLRGLSAYYRSDDVRALENWQRLSPDRLPARLIAPYRFQIDASYRTAQPPDTQNILRRQLDRLQDVGLVQPLQQIRSALGGHQPLLAAFRLAETLVPAMRQQAFQLLPRLASCFYWAIITVGEPADVNRYRRVFGASSDDPNLERLEALASEQRNDLESAHHFWQLYEKTLAKAPSTFPTGQTDRVRALIWNRMARNAGIIPDLSELGELPPFLSNVPRPERLKPDVEECYKQSLKLAPDQVETHEALFHFHRAGKRLGLATKVAGKLLERFPDHVPVLEEFGDVQMEQREYGEAVGLYQRALRGNPLDRGLRHKASTAHLFHARTFAEKEEYAHARAEYQAALALDERGDNASVLCKWAATEFKAEDEARAEELLHKALTHQGNHLAVAYNMVIEAIRLKLPPGLKKRFDRDFKAALAEPPTPAGAVAIAETTAAHVHAQVDYHGQKTHQKKVLSYLQEAKTVAFAEGQLEELCHSLQALRNQRLSNTFCQLGQQRFPNNPHFYYFEAASHLDKGKGGCPWWKINPLLERARQLAQALPPDDRHTELLERIQAAQQLGQLANPFAQLFGDFLGNFGDDASDQNDWEDDEEIFDPNFSTGGGRRRR